MKLKILLFLVSAIAFGACQTNEPVTFSGELKEWHKITLTFDGPVSSELDSVNPFTNYHLDVTFSKNGASFVVPGYYAADGDAANTSAEAGNKWRVHFAPNDTGAWNYAVSFRQGEMVAVAKDPQAGESAGFIDGLQGQFMVEPSDKPAEDLRSKGRLQYVNQRYLQFAESGEYFMKAGPDAPENLLAYEDFDATTNALGFRKSYEPHLRDFQPADSAYLWGPERSKGKALIGAISYLADQGMNVFSFLTFNIDGDDRNVYPYLLKEDISQQDYEAYAKDKKNNKAAWENYFYHYRFDVSKMAQWEKIFEYGQDRGMFLHFKTQETENDDRLDGGDLGLERKLYYRELVARYGHHLALNWNFGEENVQSAEQMKAQLAYMASIDPYQHLRVFHTYPNRDHYYEPFLGEESHLTGLSMQLSDSAFRDVHQRVLKWVYKSDSAGNNWVVSVDEPGDATHAVVTDQENPEHNNARQNALWGTLMAGGAGVEWYFGYRHPESDLTLQNFRSRQNMWDQSRYALKFFEDLPYWEMQPADEITAAEDDYVLMKDGAYYVIYQKNGSATRVDLAEGNYQARWYNPRTGEYEGDSMEISGGQQVEIPGAPSDQDQDWVVLLKSTSIESV